jgi:type II secretory ATPase GspE/PulE/Tfp pilus assembly ATPase PilB-like protein
MEDAARAAMLTLAGTMSAPDRPVRHEGMSCSKSDAIARLVDTVLWDAVQKGASQIQISPVDDAVRVRYRIDGKLVFSVKPIDVVHHDALLARLREIAQLVREATAEPVTAPLRLRFAGQVRRLRLTFAPGPAGEEAVIELLGA